MEPPMNPFKPKGKPKLKHTAESRIVEVEYAKGSPEYYGELALPLCGGLFGYWIRVWTRVTPKYSLKSRAERRLSDEKWEWEREHNKVERAMEE